MGKAKDSKFKSFNDKPISSPNPDTFELNEKVCYIDSHSITKERRVGFIRKVLVNRKGFIVFGIEDYRTKALIAVNKNLVNKIEGIRYRKKREESNRKKNKKRSGCR